MTKFRGPGVPYTGKKPHELKDPDRPTHEITFADGRTLAAEQIGTTATYKTKQGRLSQVWLSLVGAEVRRLDPAEQTTPEE